MSLVIGVYIGLLYKFKVETMYTAAVRTTKRLCTNAVKNAI